VKPATGERFKEGFSDGGWDRALVAALAKDLCAVLFKTEAKVELIESDKTTATVDICYHDSEDGPRMAAVLAAMENLFSAIAARLGCRLNIELHK
jgi:hypothetical protein